MKVALDVQPTTSFAETAPFHLVNFKKATWSNHSPVHSEDLNYFIISKIFVEKEKLVGCSTQWISQCLESEESRPSFVVLMKHDVIPFDSIKLF